MNRIFCKIEEVEDILDSLLESDMDYIEDYEVFQTEEELGQGFQTYKEITTKIIIPQEDLVCGFGFSALKDEDGMFIPDWDFVYIDDASLLSTYYE